MSKVINNISLNRKRSKLKIHLQNHNLLPTEYPYNKTNEELMDMLKANMFDEVKTYIKNHSTIKQHKKTSEEKLESKRLQRKKTSQKTSEKRKEIRVHKSCLILKEFGLLPDDLSNLTDTQQIIYDLIVKGVKRNITILEEFVNESNIKGKRRIIYNRLKSRSSSQRFKSSGHFVDLKEEDIIINEYCPFLGVKIDYRKSSGRNFLNDGHSIDRIINEKSYVTGNVWVISRLANLIKNDSSLSELKMFCINILKSYEKKIIKGV